MGLAPRRPGSSPGRFLFARPQARHYCRYATIQGSNSEQPMTDIPIRPAGLRDIAAISRIYDHAVRHGTASFEIEPPDEHEMVQRYEALRDGRYPYLVAELG